CHPYTPWTRDVLVLGKAVARVSTTPLFKRVLGGVVAVLAVGLPMSVGITAHAATEAMAQTCDPHYPDFCIPPPPPKVYCRDLPYSDFRALPPDPQLLDADHDGRACENSSKPRWIPP